MVTTNTRQNISGHKNFTGGIELTSADIKYYDLITNDMTANIREYSEGDAKHFGLILETPASTNFKKYDIKFGRGSYGESNQHYLVVPDTTQYTADKTIATTDQIPVDLTIIEVSGGSGTLSASDLAKITAHPEKVLILRSNSYYVL